MGWGKPTVSEHSIHLNHQAKTLVSTGKELVFVKANYGPGTTLDLDPGDLCNHESRGSPHLAYIGKRFVTRRV